MMKLNLSLFFLALSFGVPALCTVGHSQTSGGTNPPPAASRPPMPSGQPLPNGQPRPTTDRVPQDGQPRATTNKQQRPTDERGRPNGGQTSGNNQTQDGQVLPDDQGNQGTQFFAGGYGGYGNYTSEFEGAANGIAGIIRSAGTANLAHSQAAQNYEGARALSLENRLSGAQKYYQLRKLNTEYRQYERGSKPTSEQMFRYARDRAPSRLAASDLDPVTGTITWPVVLEQDEYRLHRERLDQLFAIRARYNGQIGPDQYLELRNATAALADELKKRIEEYPPADYVKAKSVLDSLAYEAQLTAG